MSDDATPDPDLDLDALDHDRFVRRAIELAREADAAGDEPFGSVLVRDGAVVAEARNRVRTENDIAEHPELALARRAAADSDPAERARSLLAEVRA
jgi:tRNA(Arg) A34 adenosine deaminase TadA